MGTLLLGVAGHFVGLISGILANPAMDYIDDVKQWSASWPDWLKRALVAAITAVLPTVAAAVPALHLSMNPADLLTKPEVQTIIGYLIALLLHSHNKAKSTTSTGTAK